MSNFPLQRTVFDAKALMPAYYLSVTYRDLSQRKARWAREKTTERKRPEIVKWNIPTLDNPYAGLIAKINANGVIEATAPQISSMAL